MDQKTLIELHSTLIEAGWQIHTDMTGRSNNDEAVRFSLSHPESCENQQIVLTYPTVTKTGKYELVVQKNSKLISNISYTTEIEAQYALLEICKKQTAKDETNARNNQ